MPFDPLNFKEITNEALPEAAKLANDLLASAVDALNKTLAQTEAIAGDTISTSSGILDRNLTRLEQLVQSLDGATLKGSVFNGQVPFECTLSFPNFKLPAA